jgi:hypothetical protein
MQNAPATSARTNADSIDVAERARVAVLALTDRVGYPHRGIASRLGVLLRDLVTLRMLGVNEAEIRLVATCVDGVIDDLYHPLCPQAEQILARLESDADRAEDGVSDLRLIEGDTGRLLNDHARRLDAQATASRALARSLRAKARALAEGHGVARDVARVRLGLSVEQAS